MKKLTVMIWSIVTTMSMALTMCRPISPTSLPSPIPATSSPTLMPQSTATASLPTSSPTPWPLQVQVKVEKWKEQASSREQLLQIVPNKSTLQDLYALIGYPSWRKDLPSGVALRYASEWGKFPHVVLVDGLSGKVLLVSIYDYYKNLFHLSSFTSKYGKPVPLINTTNMRSHLFFAGAGTALITDRDDNNYISYA